MEPSLDLWTFAHRYDLPYLKKRCSISIPVQTTFLKKVIDMAGVESFLHERVLLEGIEEMMDAICENTSLDATKEFGKECIAREMLKTLVDSIYRI